MKEGKSPVVYGNGTQKRDFTHVDDITRGLLLAMNSKIKYDILNLGIGKSYSLNELIEIINEIQDTEITPTYVENTIKRYIFETLADTLKTKNY